MSQNHITLQGIQGEVPVMMGYDRPTGQLFCSVFPDDDDTTDYSGLMFRQFAGANEIRDALQGLGLQVPDTVLAAVESDARMQAGNVMRKFSMQGELLAR